MTYESTNKLVVILGPTASGKSDLAVKLARRFSGRIISADSRQVYKGLNIGSGKITKKEMQDVPHYLLDVASPKRKFTVSQFQTLAQKAIQKIHSANYVPFLVGGTGFYIQAVVDGLVIPEVKPNWKLRKKLSRYNVEKLHKILEKLDPMRAKNIDAKNPVRLIRAIEIVKSTKKPVAPLKKHRQFNVLQIGIKKSPKELQALIHTRLDKRLAGIILEVKKLHENGLSFKRLEELGLEYRFVARLQRYAQHCGQAQYYEKKREITEELEKAIWQYAKRQMTWFGRDKTIHWVKNQQQAQKIIDGFLKK